MPADPPSRLTRTVAWRIAGLWMIVLALTLAAVGVFLAIRQARSVTQRLTSQAQAQAGRLVDEARRQFNEQVSGVLRAAIRHVETEPDRPFDLREIPRWIDHLTCWDGHRARRLVPSTRDTPQFLARVADYLREAAPFAQVERDALLIHSTTVGADRMVLAWMVAEGRRERPIAVAGRLNLDRLKSDVVEPLLSADSGFEVVPAAAPNRGWTRSLFAPLEDWSIGPTQAVQREQRRTVMGQTVAYLGLTILSLAILLAAMGVLVRVVRKEMKLGQMKANFVADVSHELKTPLSLIRMFSETLQSGRVTSEQKRQEYYAIITRESTRLTNLIENILDFARIEAGRFEYTLKPVDIGEVVRETYDAYREQLRHNGFEHHLSIEPSLPRVDADRGAIAQALINLINNAIKYSQDERCLVIDVTRDIRRDRRGVLISVHDRGIGIQPEERARVFEGFFRATDERVRDQGGAGLGLALVRHIVEAHQGSLQVESRLVKGSTFRIFLPESSRAPAATDPKGPGASDESG